MKSKDILNAMTDIDPATVEAAAAPAPRRSGAGKRVVLIAACAALLAAAVAAVLLVLNRPGTDVPPEPGTNADTTPGESGAAPTEAPTEPPAPLHTGGMWVDTREKKELSVKKSNHEVSIEFPELPWKLQPLYKQVSTLEYEGAVYGDAYEYTGDPVREGLVSADYATGTVTAAGEDGKPADIGIRLYPMTGGTPARRLFVRFDGNDIWAAYCLQDFDLPATWGELCAGLHLSERMLFLRGEDKRSSGVSLFSLTDADSRAIWAMLKTVSDAPGYACDDVTYEETGKELFGISSPSTAPGPVRLNLQLYENGWMITAVERYGCAFNVGPSFVAELAAYLEAHGTPVDDPADLPGSKQYTYGTVTETGEGWFRLNDGISLADPSEAVEFTVISNMVEVYYSGRWLKPGMLVKVTHEGILADEPTVIRTVDAVDAVYIDGEGEPVVQE